MSATEAQPVAVDALRARARAWLATAEVPEVPEDYDSRAAVLRDWHQVLYDAGWLGLHWPTSVGGHGLGIEHHLAFSAELARARAPQPVGSIGLEVVGPTILKYGTPAQQERFLPPLLSGREVWCQGFSEPGAGSDLAALRTRGVVDGDSLVIEGQKTWTSWATDADFCAVLVRTDPDVRPHLGISYVLVDLRSPGITIRPITMLNGDAEFNEVFYDQVRVPLTNVLGGLGAGWRLAMDTLGWERAGYSIRRRVENQITFANLLDDVRAAGPADDRTREALGRLFVQLRAFEALSARTAQRLVTGQVPAPLDSVDKLLLARTEQALTGTALDLLGAHRTAGRSPRLPHAEAITKSYLYGRAASVYGGTAQIQRSIVAERYLGLPRGR